MVSSVLILEVDVEVHVAVSSHSVSFSEVHVEVSSHSDLVSEVHVEVLISEADVEVSISEVHVEALSHSAFLVHSSSRCLNLTIE